LIIAGLAWRAAGGHHSRWPGSSAPESDPDAAGATQADQALAARVQATAQAEVRENGSAQPAREAGGYHQGGDAQPHEGARCSAAASLDGASIPHQLHWGHLRSVCAAGGRWQEVDNLDIGRQAEAGVSGEEVQKPDGRAQDSFLRGEFRHRRVRRRSPRYLHPGAHAHGRQGEVQDP